MRFKNESTLIAFLEDKPFYESNDCFCLGNTLAEAGRVAIQIVKANEISQGNTKQNVLQGRKYVGLDNV